jgi:hypothetical protein
MIGQTAVRDTAICADCGQRVDVRLSGSVGQFGNGFVIRVRNPFTMPP